MGLVLYGVMAVVFFFGFFGLGGVILYMVEYSFFGRCF